MSRNEIIIKDDCAIIKLYNNHAVVIDECYIDIEDIKTISPYRWFKRKDNRVVSNVSSLNLGVSHIRLHNLIMGISTDSEFEVDHIDKNPLNNRKDNLRVVNKSNNLMNRGIQINNSTGVCGVVSRDHNNTSPWIPQIKINRKMIRLGTRYSFDEAVKIRLIEESKLFKEHSNNFNHESQTLQLTYYSHDDSKQTFIESDLQGNIIKFEKLE